VVARTVGVLHPGEMGAAVAAALRGAGHHVLWASDGRSDETRRRAEAAGLGDTGSAGELARGSDVVLSVCPPHAAVEVARSVSGLEGIFVDANAVSPATAREAAGIVQAGGADFVDGGIVGSPPRVAGTTRLYLSGESAASVAGLFAGTFVEARVVSNEVGAASAVKMAYAAWTKGTAALLIAISELARAERVDAALADEWRRSLPDLPDRLERALASAGAKGWRWVGEMEEIAATFSGAGLPGGFHEAAAEVFRAMSAEPQRK
jgi:3-hydroxyisobutyrate dehydrogenase-like beta-hydroxyacid dehydrogenase